MIEPHDQCRKIARIDKLDRCLGRAWRQYAAAGADAPRPVGKAAGRIVRSDDQAGANQKRLLPERSRDGPLALGLQRPVVGAVDRFAVDVVGGGQRILFTDWNIRKRGVRRNTRDEDVTLAAVVQRRARCLDVLRPIAAGVDHRVPFASHQQVQVFQSVADDPLDARWPPVARLASIEHRHRVPAHQAACSRDWPRKTPPPMMSKFIAAS